MQLRRWTPFVFLFPDRYVSRDASWEEFDLQSWSSDEYVWTEDPWNGFRDFARRPEQTLKENLGDCEDYALVAASWAIAQGRENVGFGFCWEPPYPWPRHAITFDDDYVYSSGEIIEASVDEWLDDSPYVFCLRRRVS